MLTIAGGILLALLILVVGFYGLAALVILAMIAWEATTRTVGQWRDLLVRLFR